MFRSCREVVAFSLLLAMSAVAGAQQSDEALAIIDKAIEAAGGREALARYERPFYVERTGKFFIPDRATATAEEVFKETTWFPDKQRTERQTTSFGKTATSVMAFNGNEVKATSHLPTAAAAKPPPPKDAAAPKLPGRVAGATAGNADPRALAESIRLRLYVARVRTLLPLADDAFGLATMTDVTIDGRPAVGVEVSHKDHPSIRLYFDKEMTVLVKSSYEGGGMEMAEIYDDFAELDGLVYPKKISQYMRGRRFRDLVTTEFKFLDDVPAKTFDEL
jgi:hypothetical protein